MATRGGTSLLAALLLACVSPAALQGIPPARRSPPIKPLLNALIPSPASNGTTPSPRVSAPAPVPSIGYKLGSLSLAGKVYASSWQSRILLQNAATRKCLVLGSTAASLGPCGNTATIFNMSSAPNSNQTIISSSADKQLACLSLSLSASTTISTRVSSLQSCKPLTLDASPEGLVFLNSSTNRCLGTEGTKPAAVVCDEDNLPRWKACRLDAANKLTCADFKQAAPTVTLTAAPVLPGCSILIGTDNSISLQSVAGALQKKGINVSLPLLGSSARPSFGKVTIKPPGSGPNLQAGKCNGYTIQLPDGRTVVAALNETEESAQFSAALRAMGKVGADVQRVVNNSAPLQTFTGKVVNDSLSYVAFSINATSGRADLLLNSPLNKLYYTLTNAPGVGHVVLKVRKDALSGHHSAPDKGPTPPIIGKRRLLQSTPLDGDRTVDLLVFVTRGSGVNEGAVRNAHQSLLDTFSNEGLYSNLYVNLMGVITVDDSYAKPTNPIESFCNGDLNSNTAEKYRADLVMLIVGDGQLSSSEDYSGVAYQADRSTVNDARQNGWSWGCSVVKASGLGGRTFHHELGHSFGLVHDRQSSSDWNEQSLFRTFGYGPWNTVDGHCAAFWLWCWDWHFATGAVSIMAYTGPCESKAKSCSTALVWGSPGRTVSAPGRTVSVSGLWGGHAHSVSLGDDKNDPVRFLREAAPYVSQYRKHWGSANTRRAGFTTLRSSMHGKCIAADWWAPLRVFKRDNVNVFMYDCNSGLSQQFERTGVLGSATAVAIRLFGFPTATPLCLDAYGTGGVGTRVFLAACHYGSNQRWTIDAKGRLNPSYNANLCVDIAAADWNNGARLHLWDCHDGSNQVWQQVPGGLSLF